MAIQNLPVRFAIDRAGLVGADGSTHAGSFDVTYLATLPNMVVMAAADEAELVHMTYTAAEHDDGPDRLPLSARQRHRRGLARGSREAGDRQGARRARKARRWRSCRLGTRLAEAAEGSRHARSARAVDERDRPALRETARRGADPQDARRTTRSA